MIPQFIGGCLCGAVRFECSSASLAVGNCHCKDCRKTRGCAFSTAVVVPAASLKIQGAPKRYGYELEDGDRVFRAFCPECGSSLFAGNESYPEFLSLTIGSIDDPSAFTPVVDIWTSSALPWVPLMQETRKFPKDFVP